MALMRIFPVLFAALPSSAPADVVRATLAAVRAFAAGAPQSDDITIVAARYQ